MNELANDREDPAHLPAGRTSVVRWDASGIDPRSNGRRLVLATCWPLDGKFSGPLRYLVHAEMAGTTR